MVGPPLVGKSTAIKEWLKAFKGEVKVISRDEILLEEHGSDNYSEAFKTVNQKNVDKVLIKTIENSGENDENVIIDMTHLGSKRRSYNLSFFGDNYYKVAVIFPIPPMAELIKRNEIRFEKENKFIPIHVIDKMCKDFAPIKEKEGFNKIISL